MSSKKTRKKQREDVDEDVLLDLAIQEVFDQRNASDNLGTTSSSFLRDEFFKPNLRQMDAELEIKDKLSQSMIKARTTKVQPRSIKAIFKTRRNWPPFRTLGISFNVVKEEGSVKTFQVVHSHSYENLNLLFTSFRLNHDMDSITNVVLEENPYHLESLFLLAHSYLMREELTDASDVLERALFAISSSTFQFSLLSHEHRLDYRSTETRIIFNILFAFIQLLINRHCYITALQYVKLLYAKDSVNDPLAITLLIDYVSIRAEEYEYLINLFQEYGVKKNWNMLPNFLYHTAYAYHKLFERTGNKNFKEKGDTLLNLAFIRFPGFLGMLIDKIGLDPSDEVKKSGHFEYPKLRLSKGVKILENILLKHSFVFWSQATPLKWLQDGATEFSRNFQKYKIQITEWEGICLRVFVGLPVNVKRHALLMGVDLETDEEQDFFDPFPPNPGASTSDMDLPHGTLGGVIRSQFNSLLSSLRNALDQIQQNSVNAASEDVPLPNDQEERH